MTIKLSQKEKWFAVPSVCNHRVTIICRFSAPVVAPRPNHMTWDDDDEICICIPLHVTERRGGTLGSKRNVGS